MSFFRKKNATLSINDSKKDVKRFLLNDKKVKAEIAVFLFSKLNNQNDMAKWWVDIS
jgi:hypothetical protein